MRDDAVNLHELRDQMIGADAVISTPFGERLMVYCDFTASGRCLLPIERYLQKLQRIYANSHTEDDISGRSMTHLLEDAEAAIKRSVNAGPDGRIVSVGSGATGAIDKFQQILGIAIPPATRQRVEGFVAGEFGEAGRDAFVGYAREHQPVVFVGPYEHHSNEISWRHGLATVVNVDLAPDGGIDLGHLERLLEDPAYRSRMRIGSFSAASNVTGMRSPVHEIACLLHRHGAIACFDFAASAPYVTIDMNPRGHGLAGDPSLDAVFISPHKFLGGPGASGVLVFNRRLYRSELPPTVCGGGTVDYVGPSAEDFTPDIEARERAGTPGVLQILKAGLAFELKDRVGVERIERRERELVRRALDRWHANPVIDVLGNPDPERRIGVISINVRVSGSRVLHPKFVTRLLNDLFGIQTRAGCSCAGPYGHRLLAIDTPRAMRYRAHILGGEAGIKPGWCRVSLHYVMDDLEMDYLLDAIDFVAEHGVRFLPLYDFDLATGVWTHRDDAVVLETCSLEAALASGDEGPTALPAEARRSRYAEALTFARERASRLPMPALTDLGGELHELQFFALAAGRNAEA